MNKMIKKIFRYETTFVPKGLSLGFGVVAFGFVIAITLYHLSYQNSNLMRYMLAVPVIFFATPLVSQILYNPKSKTLSININKRWNIKIFKNGEKIINDGIINLISAFVFIVANFIFLYYEIYAMQISWKIVSYIYFVCVAISFACRKSLCCRKCIISFLIGILYILANILEYIFPEYRLDLCLFFTTMFILPLVVPLQTVNSIKIERK